MNTEDDLKMKLDPPIESTETKEPYSLREGIIFIVDATKPMFHINPETETTFFSQCLQVYREILRQKLSWNEADFMGMILIGTNQCDTNPKLPSILTLQTFEQVSIEQLQKIEKILKDVDAFSNEVGPTKTFPLGNALWQASRCFNGIKVKIPFRNVILFTCSENPCGDCNSEKHVIRHTAKTYGESRVKLTVVGLGKNWNANHFYKDVELASREFDQDDDYKQTHISEIEKQIKQVSRLTGRLTWKLGDDVGIGVKIFSITTKTKFPRKTGLNEKSNNILDGYTFYQPDADESDDDNEDGNNSQDQVLSKDVFKYQKHGNRKIIFSQHEVYSMSTLREPGLLLLGFKPQSCLDVTYHVEAPKFISYDESQLRGSKKLFAALLKRCHARNLMAICAITYRPRSLVWINAMIPNLDMNGFYAYKLPFIENITDVKDKMSDYVFDESNNIHHTKEEVVELFENFVKKWAVAYDPNMFLNPRLHVELANIESLAMDRTSREPPTDTTLQDQETIRDTLSDIGERIGCLIMSTEKTNMKTEKKSSAWSSDVANKVAKLQEPLDIDTLVKTNGVEKCTVNQLKEYLTSVGLKPSGKKNNLVDMVYSHHKSTKSE